MEPTNRSSANSPARALDSFRQVIWPSVPAANCITTTSRSIARAPSLYTVDTSSGALTPVGSGLGTDFLNLFSDGTTLYGIDANATSHIGIYMIDTGTGMATQTATVRGL